MIRFPGVLSGVFKVTRAGPAIILYFGCIIHDPVDASTRPFYPRGVDRDFGTPGW
jgi:hypothetical protein